jgi:hypothetical protein
VQYVREARNAGLDDVASFFEQHCHEFLEHLQKSGASG